MSLQRKVVLFGGAFDPPHLGHMNVASQILSLDYDEVWFVPTSDERYDRSSFASFEHRCEMLRLAMQECIVESRRVSLCDLQLHKELASSYTVDLLEHLVSHFPEVQFFFLIGSDRVSTLPTWKSFERLKTLTHFLVLPRLGEEKETPCPKYCTYLDAKDFRPTDYSSSSVRERVAQGETPEGLVPQSVRAYIEEHSLYEE